MNDDIIDRIAQATHAAYVATQRELGVTDLPALQEWSVLGTHYQQQNMDQARSHVQKLADVGFDVVTADEPDIPLMVLSEDIVEQMAIAEHDRWMELKRLQGFVYGPTRVDDGDRKEHPDLLHWEDLDEATKDKDRDPMRRIPRLLASVGLTLVERRIN